MKTVSLVMASITLPAGFQIEPVSFIAGAPVPSVNAPLGVLENFNGSFTGLGFNAIFRPNSGAFNATQFPSDNILELNLTNDTITFSSPLGAVPNRGLQTQSDIYLNGVSYVQVVNDVANLTSGKYDGPVTGIHFEAGLWMNIPATNSSPVLGDSLSRMGSIPHGTTINAQCLEPSQNFSGPPVIAEASLVPFAPGGPSVSVDSLIAAEPSDLRLPSDLTPFIAAGTITQDILNDPNTILRNAIEGQDITQNIAFTVSTAPPLPEFGGGATNIAFLEGDANITNPNAVAFQMNATFWIETVQYSITIPEFKPGQEPLAISPDAAAGQQAPVFSAKPPYEITEPKTINVTSTQIQYSQSVFLFFDGLIWPHISLATLIPADHVTVPDSAW